MMSGFMPMIKTLSTVKSINPKLATNATNGGGFFME